MKFPRKNALQKAVNRPRQTKAPALAEAPSSAARGAFPIVGLGASAGGLEALEQFFKNVPSESGLAFVIVTHLDPVQKGIMPELLQRSTAMKVIQVKDRTKVRPNRVYMIPPNKDMSLLHGVLHLLEPSARHGMRMPIDFFLRSLAEDQREFSVGVILSGMGTDGTRGLKAIKEEAGVTLVQEPATAKFAGMPSSCVDAGLADIVATVEELPARLLGYLRHTPLHTRSDSLVEDSAQSQVEKVVILLRSHTGCDFALYKRSTIYRRIRRRMGLHQIARTSDYVRYLRENPKELDLLFKELLIGVTSFFRDPAAWAQLRDEALPTLLTSRVDGHALRAWVPGCSTGEEAYTLAIVFKEALEQVKPRGNFSLQIFATDLNRDAVDKARKGFFPASIATEMSPERLSRFFTKEDHGYRAAKEIREMIIFAPQNIIMNPPFTRLDILSCRNLFIYFTSELQKKLLPLFHYSLKPGGVLFLGSAESIAGFPDLFTPFCGQLQLFRRQESAPCAGSVEFPTAVVRPPLSASALAPASFQTLAEQWLLQHHAPAAVLLNDRGDILFTSGSTDRYLEPTAGKANWNVFVMAREGLRYELTSAFQKARRQREPVTVRQLKAVANGRRYFVDLTIQFLVEPEALSGLAMLVFTEVVVPALKTAGRAVKPVRHGDRVPELERELMQARDEVQSSREEMQSSQEELNSTNEELQSTNEEMQSLNEELHTVNTELQARVDDLTATTSDMKNLLNSTEIVTVFLDGALCVRRFTETATKLMNFIPGDVGRPVTDLASELLYPKLADDAREVLRSLVSVEKLIAARDGRWFTMRLMPYRTLDDRIDGVVITFTDMSAVRKFEAALKAQQKRAEKNQEK